MTQEDRRVEEKDTQEVAVRELLENYRLAQACAKWLTSAERFAGFLKNGSYVSFQGEASALVISWCEWDWGSAEPKTVTEVLPLSLPGAEFRLRLFKTLERAGLRT